MSPKKLWSALFILTVCSLMIMAFWLIGLVRSNNDGSLDPRMNPDAKAGYRVWKRHYCEACHTLGSSGTSIGPEIDKATYPAMGYENLRKLLEAPERHGISSIEAHYLTLLIKWYSEAEQF